MRVLESRLEFANNALRARIEGFKRDYWQADPSHREKLWHDLRIAQRHRNRLLPKPKEDEPGIYVLEDSGGMKYYEGAWWRNKKIPTSVDREHDRLLDQIAIRRFIGSLESAGDASDGDEC
ncbi:MAG TPA: hypothetical protein VF905_09035 [Nitrospirota bacterium]